MLTPRKRKSKYIEPEVIFVLDDLGITLRDKSVSLRPYEKEPPLQIKGYLEQSVFK